MYIYNEGKFEDDAIFYFLLFYFSHDFFKK
jgi:hypothetical protein